MELEVALDPASEDGGDDVEPGPFAWPGEGGHP